MAGNMDDRDRDRYRIDRSQRSRLKAPKTFPFLQFSCENLVGN